MSRVEFGAGGLIARKNEAADAATFVLVATAASTVVRTENPLRVALILSNDGANVIYVRLASTGAVVGSGIRLPANSTITLEGYTGPVCAIAVTADTNLSIAEV